MKRVFLILASTVLGLLFFYQITAVFTLYQIGSTTSLYAAEPVEIIDLGTLGGATSQAADLNDKGEVVGSSVLSPSQESRAFLWQEPPMQPLDAVDDLSTEAHAINESGTIAGAVVSGNGDEAEMMPALWLEGAYSPLPTIDDKQGSARAINDAGFVAGHTIEQPGNQILIWQDNTITETIPSDNGLVQVNGLNNQNQIVGLIHDEAGNSAFLWQDGEFEALGALGGQNSIAYDINDSGQIVGAASLEEGLATHAFLWQDGEMSDLGTPADDPNATSRALGINSSGEIVGEAQVGDVMHAVLWQNEQIIDLNTLLPDDSDWELLRTAVSINEKGWIAGTGLIDGEMHAFLLQPPPAGFFSFLPVVAGVKQGPLPTATPGPSPTPSMTPTVGPTSTPTATPSATSTPTPTATPSTQGYDLARYITGDGRIYVVHFLGGGFDTAARHQTQFENGRFYHTKGAPWWAEWEELWSDKYYIYRGTDTSPGNGLYYTLYETLPDYLAGNPGSQWTERYMQVGEKFFRQPYVVFRRKSDCSIAVGGYFDPSWLKFLAFHNSYTFESGITVNNVVELAWLPGTNASQPIDEVYFYAEGYGLVGWKKPTLGMRSFISDEPDPGEVWEDNSREVINCLNDTANSPQMWSPRLLDGPLPEPYASMVKP